jgi:hypothetical protein
MPSPITGVWELVSDTDKALWIFTETHFGYVSERQQGRRGFAGTYSTEGHRLHITRLVSTPTDASTILTLEFQRDGDTLTTRILDTGRMLPVGHIDTYRKVSDLTSGSK